MFSKRAEQRIEKVVAFFERLHAELDAGIAECNAKRQELFAEFDRLTAEAKSVRDEAAAAGEAIGKAVRLKGGLRGILAPPDVPPTTKAEGK